jgi:hypothetical protein
MSWVLPEELMLVPAGIALLALLLLAWRRKSRSSVAAQRLAVMLVVTTAVWLAWVVLWWISHYECIEERE